MIRNKSEPPSTCGFEYTTRCSVKEFKVCGAHFSDSLEPFAFLGRFTCNYCGGFCRYFRRSYNFAGRFRRRQLLGVRRAIDRGL